MSDTYVLAVDPGPSTGVAWYRLPREGEEQGEFLGAKVMTREAFEDSVFDALGPFNKFGHPDDEYVVVCERYVISGRSSKVVRYNDSLEIIGFLRFLCRKFHHRFKEQSASDAMSFCTNDKLKKLKMYTRNDHARDATRHLVLWLVEHKLLDLRVLLEDD